MGGKRLQRFLTDKGIPRPQRAARLQVQDLHLRPETGRDTPDQTPVAPQVRRRAGHGHLKVEHRMSRNYLWYRRGDAANAVLAAAGYELSPKVGDGGNREGGLSWGGLTPPPPPPKNHMSRPTHTASN